MLPRRSGEKDFLAPEPSQLQKGQGSPPRQRDNGIARKVRAPVGGGSGARAEPGKIWEHREKIEKLRDLERRNKLYWRVATFKQLAGGASGKQVLTATYR